MRLDLVRINGSFERKRLRTGRDAVPLEHSERSECITIHSEYNYIDLNSILRKDVEVDAYVVRRQRLNVAYERERARARYFQFYFLFLTDLFSHS